VYGKLGGTKGAQQAQGIIFFLYGKINSNLQLRTGLIVHHRIVSAVKNL